MVSMQIKSGNFGISRNIVDYMARNSEPHIRNPSLGGLSQLHLRTRSSQVIPENESHIRLPWQQCYLVVHVEHLGYKSTHMEAIVGISSRIYDHTSYKEQPNVTMQLLMRTEYMGLSPPFITITVTISQDLTTQLQTVYDLFNIAVA